MNKYLISFSLGGLSNRIKCLISSMKLSKENNYKLLLYWPKDPACNCNFEDLFENRLKKTSKEQIISLTRKNKKNTLLYNDSKFKAFSDQDIFLKFGKIPENSKKDILKYLNQLKIDKKIIEKVSNFSKKFNKHTIGIHIRGGDFNILKSGIGRISKKELFIGEINEEIEKNPLSNFFLAIEDKETEKKFKELFKNRIITYPKKSKLREEENSVQEAFIELLLLSKTKKIIGTFGSTFTELAWFFGGCKQEIKIIIDEKERKKYFEKRKGKINSFIKLKVFIYNLITPKNKRLFRAGVK